MATTTSWITKTPGVCGGEACIRNSRLSVWGLVEWRRLGQTDAQILNLYPELSPEALNAAWRYYAENPLEIDRLLWANEAAMFEHKGRPVPAEFLLRGRQLGLSDEEIRDAFEPPLPQEVLDAAWKSLANAPVAPRGV